MIRGDSNMSDSKFFKCQKIYQRKQKSLKKLYKQIDNKNEVKLTIFQKLLHWLKSFIR
jgi:uncharacterized pyridoxamine 5'-phosphate oxidase family protein